jgi:hypothetical protein
MPVVPSSAPQERPPVKLLSVGNVADLFGVAPWKVSYLFDRRRLSGEMCPMVGGRRLIPEDYLPIVRRELVRMGAVASANGNH